MRTTTLVPALLLLAAAPLAMAAEPTPVVQPLDQSQPPRADNTTTYGPVFTTLPAPAPPAEASAALARLTNHPSTAALLKAHAELTAAIPAQVAEFERDANVYIEVVRLPLVEVLLLPWWQRRAVEHGEPHLAVMATYRNQDNEARQAYVLASVVPALNNSLTHQRFNQWWDSDRHPLGADHPATALFWKDLQYGSFNEVATRIAVIEGGKATVLSAEQTRELSRPVILEFRMHSPFERKINLSADRLPLDELAGRLARAAGAMLMMPVSAKTTNVSITTNGELTISDLLYGLTEQIHWNWDRGTGNANRQTLWDASQEFAIDNPICAGVNLAFEATTAPTLSELAAPTPPSAQGALVQQVFSFLRSRMRTYPATWTLLLSPMPSAKE